MLIFLTALPGSSSIVVYTRFSVYYMRESLNCVSVSRHLPTAWFNNDITVKKIVECKLNSHFSAHLLVETDIILAFCILYARVSELGLRMQILYPLQHDYIKNIVDCKPNCHLSAHFNGFFWTLVETDTVSLSDRISRSVFQWYQSI